MKMWSLDDEKKKILYKIMKAIACGFVPVISFILYCAVQGKSLDSIYLPNTACSDDIYYYKMTEGLVKFGAPLGYFGYNESRAVISTFGVWSPTLLLPWTLWGKLFGWEYFSPILCNICILSLSFIIFAILAEPTWAQVLYIAVLFFSITPFTRYLLSGMPETITYSIMIIVYGIVYSFFRRETTDKIIWMFLLITVLSSMRPYFMIFLLLPGMLWVRRSKWFGFLGTTIVIALNLLGYKVITYYFSAPYFYSSMATDFVDPFRYEGVLAGFSFVFHKIFEKGLLIKWFMSLGWKQGFTDGQIYLACCMAILFLTIWLFFDIREIKHHGEKDRRDLLLYAVPELSTLISFVAMLFAIIVLYQIPEGSRHLLVFLIGFIIVASMRRKHAIKNMILIISISAYLFVFKYDGESGYCVPYAEEEIICETEDLRNAFNVCIDLNYLNAPSYDNVVDWVAEDLVDGEMKIIPWRILFALPEGIGISCCLPQYMADNMEELKSRYIITIPEGSIDMMCEDKGMEELLRDKDFVLYKTH